MIDIDKKDEIHNLLQSLKCILGCMSAVNEDEADFDEFIFLANTAYDKVMNLKGILECNK